jgi:hypothetical protein
MTKDTTAVKPAFSYVHMSYPKYRNGVCGRNCLDLKYIRHNHSKIPVWVTRCECYKSKQVQ